LQRDELPVEQALPMAAAVWIGAPVPVRAGEPRGLQRCAVMVTEDIELAPGSR
jgi:hypothetical protein